MAWFAAWAPAIFAAVGTVMQVSAQQKQAKAAKVAGQQALLAGQYQAAQQEQAAGQEQAAAQRRALEERRRAPLVASRALDLAGASGGSVSDPSVANLLADLEGEGAYRAAVRMYEGEDRARALRQGALTSNLEGQIGLQEGQSRASAYRMQAVGSLISGASSLYSKYGVRQSSFGPEQYPAPVEDRDPYRGMDSRFFS